MDLIPLHWQQWRILRMIHYPICRTGCSQSSKCSAPFKGARGGRCAIFSLNETYRERMSWDAHFLCLLLVDRLWFPSERQHCVQHTGGMFTAYCCLSGLCINRPTTDKHSSQFLFFSRVRVTFRDNTVTQNCGRFVRWAWYIKPIAASIGKLKKSFKNTIFPLHM